MSYCFAETVIPAKNNIDWTRAMLPGTLAPWQTHNRFQLRKQNWKR